MHTTFITRTITIICASTFAIASVFALGQSIAPHTAEASAFGYTTDITSRFLGGFPISSVFTSPASVLDLGSKNSTSQVSTSTPPESLVVDESRLIASSVLVKNISTNTTLYSKNADATLPLASLTKLMTAITVKDIQNNWKSAPSQLELRADGVPLTRADALVRGGGYMSINDLLNYMLLTSSNFAANSFARNIIPESAFIAYMNHIGRSIGLKESTFVNASGLTDIHPRTKKPLFSVGTPIDVTIMLETILNKYPELAYATQVPQAVITGSNGTQVEIQNTNTLLKNPIFQSPNKRLVLGKTGFTDEAGGNLAVVLFKDNQYYSIVVMGSTISGRFDDVIYLATQI